MKKKSWVAAAIIGVFAAVIAVNGFAFSSVFASSPKLGGEQTAQPVSTLPTAATQLMEPEQDDPSCITQERAAQIAIQWLETMGKHTQQCAFEARLLECQPPVKCAVWSTVILLRDKTIFCVTVNALTGEVDMGMQKGDWRDWKEWKNAFLRFRSLEKHMDDNSKKNQLFTYRFDEDGLVNAFMMLDKNEKEFYNTDSNEISSMMGELKSIGLVDEMMALYLPQAVPKP